MEGSEGEEEEWLVTEREADMVSFNGSTESTTRTGWFLNPASISSHESKTPQFVPSHYKPISPMSLKAPRIQFHGWIRPNDQWVKWVDKLSPIYHHLWKKAGIYDAIQASKCHVRKDPSSLFGVAGFWCEETNSFIFPWFEATVTLEDVMVLGGFSAIGETVRGTLDGELAELEWRMNKEHRRFKTKTKYQKANYNVWMQYYLGGKGEGGELEHIAFLSLWVSKCVFPAHPLYTVGRHVFPIAIRLARGARIALAPAVLATLYRDLRKMKEYLLSRKGIHGEAPLVLWAPFSILQMWVWERFAAFRPESQVLLSSGDPRARRWHDATKKLNLSCVASVLESPQVMLWRPYTVHLGDWFLPFFCKDSGVWVCGKDMVDEGLESFACCLRACELVGIDCIEQYLPHRVAMQFGLDQDIPNHIARYISTWEVAWKTYHVTKKKIKMYVPPRLPKSEVTIQYSTWWKKYLMSYPGITGSNNVPHITWKVRTEGSMLKFTQKKVQDNFPMYVEGSLGKMLKWNKRRNVTSIPFAKKKKTTVQGTLMEQNKQKENGTDMRPSYLTALRKCGGSKTASIAAILRKQPPCAGKPMIHVETKLPQNSEAANQDTDASGDIKVESVIMSENFASDLLDIEENVISEDIKMMNVDESTYQPVVLEDASTIFKVDEEECGTKAKKKGSNLELEISKLKEEIALIQARVLDLESQAAVHSKS